MPELIQLSRAKGWRERVTGQLDIPVPAQTWFVEVAEDWAITAKHTHRTGPWIEYWWPTRNYLASSGRAVLGEPTRVGPFSEADAAEYREHLISKGLPQTKAKIRCADLARGDE